ncbi:MAG: mycothione reductase [Acidimicrobiales bacterium]|nr:mycothione reductase [Acidimicrobiales bacterium]
MIVGSGSGNSIPPELSGWKVAMVERGIFGGTCLNVGCIPSKMFVLPADRAVEATDSDLNIRTEFAGVDWPGLRDRIFGRIDAISTGGERYRQGGTEGLTLYRGTARFTADRTFAVELNDGGEPAHISADQVLLAAGSRPFIPDIPGLETVGFHTSDSIMRLDQLPARLGILGGGYIAAEMGHVFSGFGSEVTLFARSDRLLRTHDGDVSRRFTEVFGRRVQLELNDIPASVERRSTGIEITHADCETITEVDELLVAVGRIPNGDTMNPGAGGLHVTVDGRIATDARMATAVPGVWAIGDLTNPFQLKHVANAEAKVAFANITASRDGGTLGEVDHRFVPAAVFSHPQVASVGATEEELRAAGVDYVAGRRDFGGTAYGWALADDESFAKVLLDLDGGILGAHIIGPQAATLIQPLVQAMALGQTAHEIANEVYYIHPALTEVVENALLEGLSALG